MAQALFMGRCTNLSLSANGRSLLLYLERAGVGENRRTDSPQNKPARSNMFPILLASELRFSTQTAQI